MKDAAQLTLFKVGQKISVDLKAMMVTLPAARPGAKPVQVRILEVQPMTAKGSGSASMLKPGGKKSITSNSSVVTGSMPQLNPALKLPDLVPHFQGWSSMCHWDESKGETCESQCPPKEVTFWFGTHNISTFPLSGSVRIKVVSLSSGAVVKEWTVTNVPGDGYKYTGWLKRTVVRCHPPGQQSVSSPPPTHKLVIETSATEADKSNNTRELHIGPGIQLGPPDGQAPSREEETREQPRQETETREQAPRETGTSGGAERPQR